MLDLISDRVEVIFTSIASTIEYIKPLAVTSAQRTDLLPDMRSIGEFVSSYDTAGWVGLTAPANTPSEIVASTSTLMLSIMSEGGWPSMSALGQKQISGHVRVTSALPPKADIGSQPCDVRFVPKADIRPGQKELSGDNYSCSNIGIACEPKAHA